MRRLAERARTAPLPLSVVVLATPDEENESAGVLQAVRFLLRLRDEHGLEYVGAINTDYTTSRAPGDPDWHVYTGSIGKLLPSFLVIGKESHVGDPFDGIDANLLAADLIADLSMNPDLCDAVRGQITPAARHPPRDGPEARLRRSTPLRGLLLPERPHLRRRTPGELLARLRHARRSRALARACRIDAAERRWLDAGGVIDRERGRHCAHGPRPVLCRATRRRDRRVRRRPRNRGARAGVGRVARRARIRGRAASTSCVASGR